MPPFLNILGFYLMKEKFVYHFLKILKNDPL